MSKKIAIFCNVGLFTEIFELQLEIAQKNLDLGNKVEFISCSGFISICEINREKDLNVCVKCISRRKNGISFLNRNVRNHNIHLFSNLKSRKIVKSLKTEFKSLDELKTYKLEEFHIGQSVFSSTADINREHDPDVNKYKNEIKNFIESSAHIYLSFENYLKKENPDEVYLYNGRHALEKPIISICQKYNKTFFTYELSYNGGYDLFKNTQPQDVDYRFKQINNVWESSALDEKIKIQIGELFYLQQLGRRQGCISITESKDGRISVKNNKWNALDDIKVQNQLPKKWNAEKHNIVMFISSEFEDYTSPEFYKKKNIYGSQIEGILKIINDLDEKVELWVRLHPSFATFNVDTQEKKDFEKLSLLASNLHIIEASSKFCSYHLIKNANKIIAFRSTAGIEAAYAQKPVIMIWSHIFDKLNCCYSPKRHKEVISLINDVNLVPLPRFDAIKFGFYTLKVGILPTYYKRVPDVAYEDGWGEFKNRKVNYNQNIDKIFAVIFKNRFLYKAYLFLDSFHKFFTRLYTGAKKI